MLKYTLLKEQRRLMGLKNLTSLGRPRDVISPESYMLYKVPPQGWPQQWTISGMRRLSTGLSFVLGWELQGYSFHGSSPTLGGTFPECSCLWVTCAPINNSSKLISLQARLRWKCSLVPIVAPSTNPCLTLPSKSHKTILRIQHSGQGKDE